MDIVETNERAVVVSLTVEELQILSNALNEISNGPEAIDDWEFETRVGVGRDRTKALLEETRGALLRAQETREV